MKTIKKLNIALGVFSRSLTELSEQTNTVTYSEFSSAKWYYNEDGSYKDYQMSRFEAKINLWGEIGRAISYANSISFDLTHLYFPFTTDTVITFRELAFIMHRKRLIKKTTFYINGKKVNKEAFVRIWERRSEEIKLSELSELFN